MLIKKNRTLEQRCSFFFSSSSFIASGKIYSNKSTLIHAALSVCVCLSVLIEIQAGHWMSTQQIISVVDLWNNILQGKAACVSVHTCICMLCGACVSAASSLSMISLLASDCVCIIFKARRDNVRWNWMSGICIWLFVLCNLQLWSALYGEFWQAQYTQNRRSDVLFASCLLLVHLFTQGDWSS